MLSPMNDSALFNRMSLVATTIWKEGTNVRAINLPLPQNKATIDIIVGTEQGNFNQNITGTLKNAAEIVAKKRTASKKRGK